MTSDTKRVSGFAALGVPEDIVEALSRAHILEPFPIQQASLSDALAGRDVLGRAPTGSGKTLAFGIPMITRLTKSKPRRPNGLILSPTRELAEQIRRELDPLAAERGLKTTAIYGGVGVGKQVNALERGVDLVVACPGRLLDLIDQGQIHLDSVTSVVVDEADRMADMGFLPSVRKIIDQTSKKRQTVLFSATLGPEVQVLTDRYQTNPVTHQVGEVEPDLSLVTHRFIKIDRQAKIPLAAMLIAQSGPTVVFCRTRYGVDRVARQLKNAGVKSGLIHGRRTQGQRDSALKAFTEGKVEALVATDVAARGIHVDGVECVIHFDPPEEHTAYVHRSGRTARAGASGVVISFVGGEQLKDTRKMQRKLGLETEFEDTPELDPETMAELSSKAARIKTESHNGQKQNNRGKPKGKRGGPRQNQNGKPRSKQKAKKGSKSSDSKRSAGNQSRPQSARPKQNRRRRAG